MKRKDKRIAVFLLLSGISLCFCSCRPSEDIGMESSEEGSTGEETEESSIEKTVSLKELWDNTLSQSKALCVKAKLDQYDEDALASALFGDDIQNVRKRPASAYGRGTVYESDTAFLLTNGYTFSYYLLDHYNVYCMAILYRNSYFNLQQACLSARFPEHLILGRDNERKSAPDISGLEMEEVLRNSLEIVKKCGFRYDMTEIYEISDSAIRETAFHLGMQPSAEDGRATEDKAWLSVFRKTEIEGIPYATIGDEGILFMIHHPEYGLVYAQGNNIIAEAEDVQVIDLCDKSIAEQKTEQLMKRYSLFPDEVSDLTYDVILTKKEKNSTLEDAYMHDTFLKWDDYTEDENYIWLTPAWRISFTWTPDFAKSTEQGNESIKGYMLLDGPSGVLEELTF